MLLNTEVHILTMQRCPQYWGMQEYASSIREWTSILLWDKHPQYGGECPQYRGKCPWYESVLITGVSVLGTVIGILTTVLDILYTEVIQGRV